MMERTSAAATDRAENTAITLIVMNKDKTKPRLTSSGFINFCVCVSCACEVVEDFASVAASHVQPREAKHADHRQRLKPRLDFLSVSS